MHVCLMRRGRDLNSGCLCSCVYCVCAVMQPYAASRHANSQLLLNTDLQTGLQKQIGGLLTLCERNRTMKTSLLIGLVVVGLTLAGANVAYAETREYLLGDIDGISYDGAGSVDDVYLSPAMAAWAAIPDVAKIVDFDETYANQDVPFTFAFPLAEDEEVIGATLTIALRATDSLVSSDELAIFKTDASEHWKYWFSDLGWVPLPTTGSHERTVDLGNIFGDSYLSLLQSGQLNIVITDDSAVDYAKLSVEVIPEPATVGLLAMGGLALLRRRV